eukprot:Rmarinus@m.6758
MEPASSSAENEFVMRNNDIQDAMGNRLKEEDIAVPDHFRNFIDHFRCSACNYFGASWMVLPCGCILCEDCIDARTESDDMKCPACDKEFSRGEVRPCRDRNSQTAMLVVRCQAPGRGNGCEWEGKLDSREGHVAECGYHPMGCPHEGCEAQPLRKDLDNHKEECGYRLVKCCHPLCSAFFQQQHQDDRLAHEDGCGKMPVACDLCQEEMCKENIQSHIESTCEEAVVTCTGEWMRHMNELSHNPSPENGIGRLDAEGSGDLSFLSHTCTWEGKRRKLSPHCQTCVSFAMCSVVLPLKDQLLEKTRILEEQAHTLEELQKKNTELEKKQAASLCNFDSLKQQLTRDKSTYAWDIRHVDPKKYKRGDKVKSPEFYLRGRKWQITLKPMGASRKTSNNFAVYLTMLDAQEGERFDVKYKIKYGETERPFTDTYTKEKCVWGYTEFAPIPDEMVAPIEIEILQMNVSTTVCV